MQHADEAFVEVTLTVEGIEKLPRGRRRQAKRHRVDGEIATSQVLFNRRRLDGRQCAGARIGLRARLRQVDTGRRELHGGGAESQVRDDAPLPRLCQLPRQCDGVAFDGHVEVDVGAPEQQVAHAPADEIELLTAANSKLNERRGDFAIARRQPRVKNR